jgi:hypothetical protein
VDGAAGVDRADGVGEPGALSAEAAGVEGWLVGQNRCESVLSVMGAFHPHHGQKFTRKVTS